MPDDKSKTGPADDTRININQKHEVDYWTEKLGCTKEQLVACVGRVGPMVVDVKRCLGK